METNQKSMSTSKIYVTPENRELTCLRCGWISPEREVDPNLKCPTCKTDIAVVFTNPEGFCLECKNKPRGLGILSTECYSVTDARVGEITWNVQKAYKLIKENKLPVLEMKDPSVLARYIYINETEPVHYDHVDINEPGIIAEFMAPVKQKVFALIDGSHRAARCLKEGKPFKFYSLPEELSYRCMMSIFSI